MGDTSSDSIICYYYALPTFIDFVCETKEEKKRPIDMLVNTTAYVLANNYYLIDITGKPTKWAFWGP